MNNDKKIALDLYKKIYLIRRAEVAIQKYYAEDEMKTPMHMSMGEEAAVVGVVAALRKVDQVFGYYRSHALFLAKTNDVDAFFAELYGQISGPIGGLGGSMHIAAPEHGLLGVSAVVASGVAPAVGCAFANQYQGNQKITTTFFGDGAVEEGVVWESLNAACLMKLPIIFVCLDNGLAVDVEAKDRQGFKSIPDIVKAYKCLLIQSNTTDVNEIYQLTKATIEHIKKNKTPVFMHLKYYRMLQHIGIISDFDSDAPRPKGGFEKTGYRSEEEYKLWLKKDPLKVARKILVNSGFNDRQINKVDEQINEVVEQSILKAKKAKLPSINNLTKHVYASN